MSKSDAPYNPLKVPEYRLRFSNPELTKKFQDEIAAYQDQLGYKRVARQLGRYIRMTDYYLYTTTEQVGEFDTVFTGVPAPTFIDFVSRRGLNLRVHSTNRLQNFQSLSATLLFKPESFLPAPKKNARLEFAYTYPVDIASPDMYCEFGYFSSSRFTPRGGLESTALGIQTRRDRINSQIYYKQTLEQKEHRAPNNFVLRLQAGAKDLFSSWIDYKFRVSTRAQISQRLKLGSNSSHVWPYKEQQMRLMTETLVQWASNSPLTLTGNRDYTNFHQGPILSRLMWSSIFAFGIDFGWDETLIYPYAFASLFGWSSEEGRVNTSNLGVGMDVSLTRRLRLRGLANLWRKPDDQQFQVKLIYND